jgi:hypothetical protein
MTKRKDLAIVGIGCRFPGNANTPEEFWNLMCNEQDAIVPVPTARWDVRKYYDANPEKPGKTYVKEGGFLHQEVTEFDPEFFNISPREAMTMDPQQRLLLESAWEAIEDSGTPLKNLQKLRTAVFVGGFCLDSKLIQLNPLNKDIINSFTSAAITLCILSNRISHAFDLTGPSGFTRTRSHHDGMRCLKASYSRSSPVVLRRKRYVGLNVTGPASENWPNTRPAAISRVSWSYASIVEDRPSRIAACTSCTSRSMR